MRATDRRRLAILYLATSKATNEIQEWSRSIDLYASPIISILEPKSGAVVVSGHGDVRLDLTVDVQSWCVDNGGDSCAPLSELVVCVFARRIRMFCSPILNSERTAFSMMIALAFEHLPESTFDIEARLLWAPLRTSPRVLSKSTPVSITKISISARPSLFPERNIAGKSTAN
jgi:hypothetical protein